MIAVFLLLCFGGQFTVAAELVALPITTSMTLDGESIILEAYTIAWENFVKLRDLAFVLKDTTARFEVAWDQEHTAISLSSGISYTPTGFELQRRSSENKKATPLAYEIFLDGMAVPLGAYTIEGNNYIRISEIAKAIGIYYGRGGKNDTLILNTDAPYSFSSAPTLLAPSEDMGEGYIDSIVFMGDSTTRELLNYGVLSSGAWSTQVWTPASGTFALFDQRNIQIQYPGLGQPLTIEKAVEMATPEYMVITLGINGVSFMNEQSFKSEYKTLINRIREASPQTKIILNNIYPVARNYGLLREINNDKIHRANAWIYSVAEEADVRFIDTSAAIMDSEGWLITALQSGDGMHLTSEGYRTVLYYIRTHGYK